MFLDAADQLATGVIPQSYFRVPQNLAERKVWDASKEAYVTVETPSKHIAGMCEWLRDRAMADARQAKLNKFNPSFYTAKPGERESEKENDGLFAWNATGYSPAAKPVFADNTKLLAALYELRNQQIAVESELIESMAVITLPSVPADPWAEARALKKAAKSSKTNALAF